MRIKAGTPGIIPFACLALIGVLTLVSCSGRQDVPVKVTTMSSPDSTSMATHPISNDFFLGPEDFIEIRFHGDATLDMETEVRPDGTLSIPLLDEPVQVFGMTPRDLELHIEAGVARFLKNPSVFVNVKDVGSSSVFVLGEVRNPQIVSVSPMTLSAVLSRCGGLNRDSDAGQIIVIRKWNQAEPIYFEVNYDSFLGGESMLPDLPLMRYDIVIVPRSRISKVKEFIENFFEAPYAIPRLGIETAIFFDVLSGSYEGYIR